MNKLEEIELPPEIVDEIKRKDNSGAGYCEHVKFCKERQRDDDCWKRDYLNCSWRLALVGAV